MSKEQNSNSSGIVATTILVCLVLYAVWIQRGVVWEKIVTTIEPYTSILIVLLVLIIGIPFFIWITMKVSQLVYYFRRYSQMRTVEVILSRDDTTEPFEVMKFFDAVNGMLLTRFPWVGWFQGFPHLVWEQGVESGRKYIRLSAPGPILDRICNSFQSVYQNIRFKPVERKKEMPIPSEYMQMRLQRSWIYPIQTLKTYQKSISESFFATLDDIEGDAALQIVLTPMSLRKQGKLGKKQQAFEAKHTKSSLLGPDNTGLDMTQQKELKASIESRGKGLFQCEIRMFADSPEARQSIVGAIAESSGENRLVPEYYVNWLLRRVFQRLWWRWWVEEAMPAIGLGPKVKLSTFHLSTLLQLPSMRLRVSGLERSSSRRVPVPMGIPGDEKTAFLQAENGQHISIPITDRYGNVLFIGMHGSGKTTALCDYGAPVLADPEQSSVIVIHDVDDAKKFLDYVPKEKKVYIIDLSTPSDFGLNILADDHIKADTLSGNLLSTFRTAYGDDAVAAQSGDFLQQSFLALRKVREYQERWRRAIPIIDFRYMRDLVTDDEFRTRLVSDLPDNNTVHQYWTKQFTMLRESQNIYVNKILPILNKYNALLASERVEKILCHPNPITLRRAIRDERAVLILYTAQNEVGEENAKLFANMLMSLLFQAISSQADVPEEERVKVNLFLDEVQSYANKALKKMLEESRKYGARTAAATLSLSSIEQKNLQNVFKQLFAHKIVFRNNDMEEADMWSKTFAQLYAPFIGLRDEDQDRVRIGADDIAQMDRFHAVCRLQIDGKVKDAFIAKTIKDRYRPDWRKHHPWPIEREIELHPVKAPELSEEEQKKFDETIKQNSSQKKDRNPKKTEEKRVSKNDPSNKKYEKPDTSSSRIPEKEIYPSIGSMTSAQVKKYVKAEDIPYFEAKEILQEILESLETKTKRGWNIESTVRKMLKEKWTQRNTKGEAENTSVSEVVTKTDPESNSKTNNQWPKVGRLSSKKVEEIVTAMGVSLEAAYPALMDADKEIQRKKEAGEKIPSQPQIIRDKIKQFKSEKTA